MDPKAMHKYPINFVHITSYNSHDNFKSNMFIYSILYKFSHTKKNN